MVLKSVCEAIGLTASHAHSAEPGESMLAPALSRHQGPVSLSVIPETRNGIPGEVSSATLFDWAGALSSRFRETYSSLPMNGPIVCLVCSSVGQFISFSLICGNALRKLTSESEIFSQFATGGTRRNGIYLLNIAYLILPWLNSSHLQSTLHLMQCTYGDIFSTSQNSFRSHRF